MGFASAKAAVVEALRDGNFEHEARAATAEKNLLAVGDVDADEVASFVLQTRSQDYGASPHHWDRTVVVHTFKPTVRDVRWYIKVYFIESEQVEDGGRRATFVSVHRARS